MRIEDSTYQDSDVVLDGNVYLRCSFENCNLVYRGGEVPFLDACRIVRSSIVLAGDAMRTRDFLRQVYADAGLPGLMHVLGLDKTQVIERPNPH